MKNVPLRSLLETYRYCVRTVPPVVRTVTKRACVGSLVYRRRIILRVILEEIEITDDENVGTCEQNENPRRPFIVSVFPFWKNVKFPRPGGRVRKQPVTKNFYFIRGAINSTYRARRVPSSRPHKSRKRRAGNSCVSTPSTKYDFFEGFLTLSTTVRGGGC